MCATYREIPSCFQGEWNIVDDHRKVECVCKSQGASEILCDLGTKKICCVGVVYQWAGEEKKNQQVTSVNCKRSGHRFNTFIPTFFTTRDKQYYLNKAVQSFDSESLYIKKIL